MSALQRVAYTYYRTGHASNITIKDALDPIYRDLALYYDASGRLGYALWDEWELDSKTGLPDMLTYERTRALEFRYDPDGRQRYMARELDPDELPDIVPLESPKGRWVEYSGLSPYADGEYEHGDDESFEVTRRYEQGAEIDLLEEETLWQYGDLIGSTIAETDDGENTENVQAYTAFGERIGAGEVNSRYRYGGGWGYESGLLVLEGAATTAPIEFLHLGERWYQPNVGRFIQRDPIGIAGGMNVYLYCISNPVSMVDPLGKYHWDGLSPGDRIIRQTGPQPIRPGGAGIMTPFLHLPEWFDPDNSELQDISNKLGFVGGVGIGLFSPPGWAACIGIVVGGYAYYQDDEDQRRVLKEAAWGASLARFFRWLGTRPTR